MNAGADPEKGDFHGYTPLMHASRRLDDHCCCVEALIEHHVQINSQNHFGRTALAFAVAEGNSNIAHYLLSHGAKSHIDDQEGITPWHLAVGLQKHAVLRTLLQFAAVPLSKTSKKQTVLHALAAKGSVRTMEILVGRLPSSMMWSEPDCDGNTPRALFQKRADVTPELRQAFEGLYGGGHYASQDADYLDAADFKSGVQAVVQEWWICHE